MLGGYHFISYSSPEAREFAIRLTDTLKAGPPVISAWLDKRELRPGPKWGGQIATAIKSCDSLLFVMTADSVETESVCEDEWDLALHYKKPVVPLKLQTDIELPFRLRSRHYIDFTNDFETGLAKLRQHLRFLASPKGQLEALRAQLADAKRDLRRADDVASPRIQRDIRNLEEQIASQEQALRDPEAAARRVHESIERGLERDRQGTRPPDRTSRTRFINPPPVVAPSYFQDRYVETKLIGNFLKDPARCLMTIVGRGGTGKTAMACRLLKSLESGQLPDDGGPWTVDGIVYLSARGSRRVNLQNLFADLLQLLPDDVADHLRALYKDLQATVEAKVRALLKAFSDGQIVVLLDNFEELVDPEKLCIRESELDETLRVLLNFGQHGLKVIITTRIPTDLGLEQPARQQRLDLDKGLPSPFAENVLRAMDTDGTVGLQSAPNALLTEARERTRGYPRALETLFAILSADRDTSLIEMLKDTSKLLPEHVVDVLVGEAFSRLYPTAQRVMEALAIYGRPVSPSAVDYVLQPYVLGVDSAPVLKRLVNMKLTRSEAGRYYLHPVDRDYAISRVPEGEKSDRDRLETPPYTQYALLERAADYFAQARKPSEEWKEIEDLESQLAEFDLRVAARNYDAAADVLFGIDEYLDIWGNLPLSAKMHQALYDRLDDDDLSRANFGWLGNAYYRMGQYREALRVQQKELSMALKAQNKTAIASALVGQGAVHEDLGNIAEAKRCLEEALSLAKQTADRPLEAIVLANLGNVYSEAGKESRAVELTKQALAINREIGDETAEARTLGNLAISYSELGQTVQGLDCAQLALTIARKKNYRLLEGNTLASAGAIYAQSGETPRAIEFLHQALSIIKEIGDLPREGNYLTNIGDCHAALGDIAAALDCYERALAIARETGVRRQEAFALIGIAQMRIDQAGYAPAQEQARTAVAIGREISSIKILSCANTTLALASVYAGDAAGARAAIEEARRHDVPTNLDNVLSLHGLIALRQGHIEAAREAFRASVAHAGKLLSGGATDFDALDNRALAFSGLALCDDLQQVAAAIDDFRAARAINRAPGTVMRIVKLFDELARMDTAGSLAPVRRAAVADVLEVPAHR